MEPRRTFGSNCVSIGGKVVRLDGGGESMNIGVGPELFIAGAAAFCDEESLEE